ncbi:thiamine pyrophosphate-requiring protein [Actinomadura sp. HBU206391]|uniref:thiamine pyrophosphate-requiring protein n=1 Tax=Actinomadura sp. HBU206391 TaxID=2731692 RepID=UPI0016500E96|nr:thiamine pyrophosphate-requiring protein [Actinomadura sp. HBU206391]MBC6462531.1 thiamine pyrophosphate-requiring protein [Actinomadura sp. HBU206391]
MVFTVADHLLERLREWGVEFVFGYPGDGIIGLLAAFEKAGNRPRFVQSRHEEMSALAAVGYAKFSGRPGVCMATSGPGAAHLINGLYDAKLDHVPVVAVVGQTARTALGGDYMQEIDLPALFKDVAGAYVQMATVAPQFPNLIDRAIRTALADRAPTCVIVPVDLQEEPYQIPAQALRYVPSSPPGYARPITRAPETEVARAAEVINAGERVAMLIGQGARAAAPEVVETADITGAGVAKALLGKDVLPDDLPFVTGAIGLLGTRPSYELMRDCDTLLIVGSNFPYSQFLPEFGVARAVQIDVDGRLIGMRYPIEVPLIGDAAVTLRALIPRLRRKQDRTWRNRIEKSVSRWWATVERQAHVEADPINPMLPFWELSSRLPHDAIVTTDSGSAANWYARNLCFRNGVRGSLSGTLATMGCAVPYAIGAKFAHPGRPVIALVGDGAMQMNGLAELITVKRHAPQWPDARFIVAVLHNNDLNEVTWEMRAMAGAPKFEESQSLPDVSYAMFARSLGMEGIEVEKPEAVAPAWDRAMRADRPVLLDIHTDPDIPPIPPHVDFEQIKDMVEAVVKGDPDRWDVVRKGLETKVQELYRPL